MNAINVVQAAIRAVIKRTMNQPKTLHEKFIVRLIRLGSLFSG
jgi:hypothetical protein